jgi:hypothetical protein
LVAAREREEEIVRFSRVLLAGPTAPTDSLWIPRQLAVCVLRGFRLTFHLKSFSYTFVFLDFVVCVDINCLALS